MTKTECAKELEELAQKAERTLGKFSRSTVASELRRESIAVLAGNAEAARERLAYQLLFKSGREATIYHEAVIAIAGVDA